MPPRQPEGTGPHVDALILPGAQPKPQRTLDPHPTPDPTWQQVPLAPPSNKYPIRPSSHPHCCTEVCITTLSRTTSKRLNGAACTPHSPFSLETCNLVQTLSSQASHVNIPRQEAYTPPPRTKACSCLRTVAPATTSTWNSPLRTQAQLLSFHNQLPLLGEASRCPFSTCVVSFALTTSPSYLTY